jgi:hypothetical protein
MGPDPLIWRQEVRPGVTASRGLTRASRSINQVHTSEDMDPGERGFVSMESRRRTTTRPHREANTSGNLLHGNAVPQHGIGCHARPGLNATQHVIATVSRCAPNAAREQLRNSSVSRFFSRNAGKSTWKIHERNFSLSWFTPTEPHALK